MSVSKEVKQALDIVDIVSEYTELSKSGREYRGPCPIHNGLGPNLSVSQDKQVYICHTCKSSGSVLDFYSEVNDVSFGVALEKLAEIAGVEVDVYDNEESKARLVAEKASEYFRGCIAETSSGIQYLSDRGIEVNSLDGVGYCPGDVSGMLQFIEDHQTLHDIGLLKTEGNRTWCPMATRLVFSVYDIFGRVCGFQGRRLNGSGPKWINSPNSEIFDRSSSLYGIHIAKRTDGPIILVEGITDVIAMHQMGWDGAVASLGSGITEQQARTLSNENKHCVVLYDSDEAGTREAFKSAKTLLSHGCVVEIGQMEKGMDPGQDTSHRHKKKIGNVINQAKDVLTVQIDILEDKGYLGTPAKKRMALDKLKETVDCVSDPVVRDMYISEIESRLKVSAEFVFGEKKKETTAPVVSEKSLSTLEDIIVDFALKDEVKLEAIIINQIDEQDFQDKSKWKQIEEVMDGYGDYFDPVDEDPVFTIREWEEAIQYFSNKVLQRKVDGLSSMIALSDNKEDKFASLRKLAEEKMQGP